MRGRTEKEKEMPYSLELLVMGQYKPSYIPFKTPLKLEWENGNIGRLRLKRMCPIMNSVQGIWYNLLLKNEVYFRNTNLLYETDFDQLVNIELYPWVDEEVKENFTPFGIKKEYFPEVKTVIGYLMNQSPIRQIMILPLHTRIKTEVIQGLIPYDEYFDMILRKEIPFNVCTIVCKNR